MHIRNSFSRVVLNAKIYVVLKTQANLFNHVLKLCWKKHLKLLVLENIFGLGHFKLFGIIIILGLHYVAQATTAEKLSKKNC